MKLSTLLPFLLCILVQSLNAQKPKFKKVSEEELLKTHCEYDSLAAAEYLFLGCEIEYQYNEQSGRFDVIYKHHKRIKIYNEKGKAYADHIIRYYTGGSKKNDEKISELEAYTFYLEGDKIKKTELDDDDIFEKEESKYYSSKGFAMPNVSDGCVLDIYYELRSPYYSSINEFYFQQNIPVQYSLFETYIPEYYNYNFNFKGLVPLTLDEEIRNRNFRYSYVVQVKTRTNDAKNEKIYKTVDYQEFQKNYSATNVKAVVAEPFVYSMNSFKSSLKLELLYTKFPNSAIEYYTRTWDDIAKTLMESHGFGDQMDDNYKATRDVLASVADLSPIEKTANLYTFVKDNFTWNGYSSDRTDKGIKKLLEEGSGNSADINLLLVNLLKKGGIQAFPMVSKLSSSGFLNHINPSMSELEYVTAMAYIDDKFIYLDATDKNLAMNMMPKRSLNLKGVLISETGGQPIDIINPNEGRNSRVLDLSVNGDQLEGSMKQMLKGYDIYRVKNNYSTEEDYVKSLNSDDVVCSDVVIDGFSTSTDKMSIEAKVLIKHNIQDIDGKIIIDLDVAQGDVSSPFTAAERNFALFFESQFSNTDIIKIEIPDGYQVESIPEALKMVTEGNTLNYIIETAINGNHIIITNRNSLNETIIPPMLYTGIKILYGSVEAKYKEKIVLSKVD